MYYSNRWFSIWIRRTRKAYRVPHIPHKTYPNPHAEAFKALLETRQKEAEMETIKRLKEKYEQK